MIEPELISIIMPTKNAASFLDDCLNSIIEQTETNWELLAIDDNSSDNSLEKLKAFAQKDRRIKVFCCQGSGIIAALQTGYQHSKGNFITRMDADDLMTKDKIETLKKSLQESGTGHLATGLVSYFSEHILGQGYLKYAEWLNQLSQTASNYAEIYKECVIPSPCWMAYRTDFEAVGGFNSSIYPEDYDLCFRFYASKLKLIPADKIIHLWRDHPTRSSRNDLNYRDNNFLNLKLKYFLELEHDSAKTLALWGAGKKGKNLAKLLINQNIDFTWVSNNDKKTSLQIYGKSLINQKQFSVAKNNQFIIAVANPLQQAELKSLLSEQELYFFC